MIPNALTAGVAFVLMLLVARGFGPYLRFRGAEPPDLMRLALVLVAAKTLLRMAYWDLVRPLLGWLEIMAPYAMTLRGQVINTGLNMIAIAAALAALAALHRSLPEADRRQYNWLTAPFYPRTINLFRRKESA
jgi:hypothetical protein